MYVPRLVQNIFLNPRGNFGKRVMRDQRLELWNTFRLKQSIVHNILNKENYLKWENILPFLNLPIFVLLSNKIS